MAKNIPVMHQSVMSELETTLANYFYSYEETVGIYESMHRDVIKKQTMIFKWLVYLIICVTAPQLLQ